MYPRFLRRAFAASIAVASAALAPHAAAAQALSTTFSGGNSQVGNMFDVTTFGSGIRVTALDINVEQLLQTPATLNVYLTSGGYAGKESAPGAWTLVASATVGSANPTGTPTFVDIGDFDLAASSTFGMYVMFAGQPDFGAPNLLAYTDGANTYQNADLRIDTGIGVGGTFGPTFSPRTWNGTIHYTTSAVPEPATLGLFAAGALVLGGVATRRRRVR